MMTLIGPVETKASPGAVEDRLRNTGRHCREWHPDRVKCVNPAGRMDEDDGFCCDGYLNGRLYGSTCRAMRIAGNDEIAIEFVCLPLPDGMPGTRVFLSWDPQVRVAS